MYAYIYIHTYIHICIHICISIYVYVYIYTHSHMCIMRRPLNTHMSVVRLDTGLTHTPLGRSLEHSFGSTAKP